MTDELLGADQPPQEPKNFLEHLVGENRKFASVEDLAKGKYYADQTNDLYKKRLDDLELDYKRLREENMTKAKLEDLIDQLSSKQLASSELPEAKEVTPKPTIDPKEIESLVSSKVQEIERSKIDRENLNQVISKLKERYGTDYQNTFKQQIDQLGLTPEEATSLAKRSPSAFNRMFGLDAQQQKTDNLAPIRSSTRNDNFAPTAEKKRTWSYYQEQMKKDPNLKFDRQFNVQMAKDAVDLGETFRDTGYYVKNLHEE